MVMTPELMFEHYGHDQACKIIEDYMDEKDLQIFSMMCNVMDTESHKILRYVFVYTRHDSTFANSFDPFC